MESVKVLKVLVVTGLMAENVVKESLSKSDADSEVYALPVPVASLMSPEFIVKMLEKKDLSKVGLILIPGLITGDALSIEKRTGIKTRKGPKNAADLPVILKSIGKTELSTVLPADELVSKALLQEAERTLHMIERESMKLMARKGTLAVGFGEAKVLIGSGLPMRVLAEIVDASILPDDEIQRMARHLEASGADIIDIGMVAGGGHPEDSARAVKAVKRCAPKPVSIDTSDPAEIGAAVDSGVDLILSVNAENMEEVAKFATKIPTVVTSAGRNHRVPDDAKDRTNQLNRNIRRAKSLGFSKIIADPILNPLMTANLAESIFAYARFRKTDPTIPLLFGSGNVTELMDADSIGANLLLAGLAAEVGANILLTTEASVKTRGSVREIARAAKMVALARARRSAPEDLGIDLLVMKEKRWREEPPRIHRKIKRISTSTSQELFQDPRGSFKVALDRQRNELILFHYPRGQIKPDLMINGVSPDILVSAAIKNNLISKLQHAYYLGRELEKARIALDTGKSYLQDFELLFGRKSNK